MTPKLIKFDLPINGIKAKKLDELRNNLTDELVNLAKTGQLERWLKTRQHLAEAQAVTAVLGTALSDKDLFLGLCAALGVTVHPEDAAALFDAPPQPGQMPTNPRYREICAAAAAAANDKELFVAIFSRLESGMSSEDADALFEEAKRRSIRRSISYAANVHKFFS